VATTPSSEANKTPRNRKRAREGNFAKKPFERVAHEDARDMHPVDAVVDRRLPARPLRRRIKHLTREVVAALGTRRQLWMNLKEAINELHGDREEEFFNLGFEHGFAAGRSAALNLGSKVRALSARLRDCAIQNGGRKQALPAVLAAAFALAFPAPTPKPADQRKARKS
jgi:hypothetical protein